jgi:hypothetical protein
VSSKMQNAEEALSDRVRGLVVESLQRSGRGFAHVLVGAPPKLDWARLERHDEPEQMTREVLCPLAHECRAQLAAFGTGVSWHRDVWDERFVEPEVAAAAVAAFEAGETLCCALLATVVLERALGNLFVCLEPGARPPPLFRDMMEHAAMQRMGRPAWALLRALMGHPSGLNLRNILWHGFLGTVAPEWLALLMVLAASLSSLLARFPGYRRLPQPPLMSRAILRGSAPPAPRYGVSSLDLPARLEQRLREAFAQHAAGRRLESLALLFPSLEHALRIVYCRENQCPQLQLTADSVTLYTTMETFIRATVSELDPVRRNRLVGLLGEGPLLALMDLMFLPAGPRLRDRLSHGQLDAAAVPQPLLDLAFVVAAGVLRADAACEAFVAEYSSRTHPKVLARQQLKRAVHALSDLNDAMNRYRSREDQSEEEAELFRLRVTPHPVRDVIASFHALGEWHALECAPLQCFDAPEELLGLYKKIRGVAKEMRRASVALQQEVAAAAVAGPVPASFKVFDQTNLFAVVGRAVVGVLVHWMLVMENGETEFARERLDKALLTLLSFVQGLHKAVLKHTVPQQCDKLQGVLARFRSVSE